MSNGAQQAAQQLTVADPVAIRQELDLPDPTAIQASQGADPELTQKADDLAARIVSIDLSDTSAQEQTKAAVESMGANLQREAARRSAMLKQPLEQLMKRGEDGGEVANSLIDLKLQVEALDPTGIDFEKGWLLRTLGHIPGIGTPIKRYFSRYQSAASTIDAIIRSLKNGKEQLKRDNITLADDQKAMRALTLQLERAVRLGQLLDQRLQARLSTEIPEGDARYKFISEEILFPLRQRIMDLQQQLLVNQQGFLTVELVIRNNKELIRGVDRALNVTVNALQIAATLAIALANQKIVLDKIQAITSTTEDLLAGTAERLKTQGVEIQKQASSTQISMDVLRRAFTDIRSALDEVSRYRQAALPKMAANILEMDKLAHEADEQIRKVEKAEKMAGDFSIEIIE